MHLFHLSVGLCDNFQPSYNEKKTGKIVKFMKICQTVKILTKDGQRITLLKLVIPPNLLRKENNCLILPPEGPLQARGRNTRVFLKFNLIDCISRVIIKKRKNRTKY